MAVARANEVFSSGKDFMEYLQQKINPSEIEKLLACVTDFLNNLPDTARQLISLFEEIAFSLEETPAAVSAAVVSLQALKVMRGYRAYFFLSSPSPARLHTDVRRVLNGCHLRCRDTLSTPHRPQTGFLPAITASSAKVATGIDLRQQLLNQTDASLVAYDALPRCLPSSSAPSRRFQNYLHF